MLKTPHLFQKELNLLKRITCLGDPLQPEFIFCNQQCFETVAIISPQVGTLYNKIKLFQTEVPFGYSTSVIDSGTHSILSFSENVFEIKFSSESYEAIFDTFDLTCIEICYIGGKIGQQSLDVSIQRYLN